MLGLVLAVQEGASVDWAEWGVAGVLIGVLTTMGLFILRWFMARFDSRDEEREQQNRVLITALQQAVANQTDALATFRRFEQDEMQMHARLMSVQDEQTRQLGRVAEILERVEDKVDRIDLRVQRQ